MPECVMAWTVVRSVGYKARTSASATEFLRSKYRDAPGRLVLDVRMPGVNRLDVQRELRRAGTPVPIISTVMQKMHPGQWPTHNQIQTRHEIDRNCGTRGDPSALKDVIFKA
jgi:CheY-like chemotaxis protein